MRGEGGEGERGEGEWERGEGRGGEREKREDGWEGRGSEGGIICHKQGNTCTYMCHHYRECFHAIIRLALPGGVLTSSKGIDPLPSVAFQQYRIWGFYMN